MRRAVVLELGGFAFKALTGEADQGSRQAPAALVQAIRCYLNDRGSRRPGWLFPAFLRDKENGEERVELDLDIEEDLWRSLEDEAGTQGVTVRQMAEHATLYYAAEVDAGRITRRILDHLEGDESRR
jgi:hypothetical protein